MIDEEVLLPIEKTDETAEEPEFSFATVEAVGAAGVTLILDGAEESGGKSYPCNAALLFRPGDRVKVHRDSGILVVEFPLGAPGSRYPLPPGGSNGQVLKKASDEDYDVSWENESGGGSLPSGGSNGQVLTKTTSGAAWKDAQSLPPGGTAGKFLRKKTATDYDAEWADPSVSTLAASSAYAVQINTSGVIQSINNNQPSLGSGSYGKQFKDIYTSGGNLSFGAAKLGFFGATPIARKSLSTSATLAQLIQALKDYGLFN